MATVTKRKWKYNGEDKTAWILRYVDATGSRKQETFKRQKDADKRRVIVEAELQSGLHVAVSDSCTLRQLADMYFDELQRRNKIGDRMTMTALKAYRSGIYNHIVPALGALKLTAITPHHIQNFINENSTRLAKPTVVRNRDLLKLMFDLGVTRGLVARNIIKESRIRVPVAQKKRVRVPSRAEINILLKAFETKGRNEMHRGELVKRAAILTALFCGLRRGEICGLHWEHVDFEKGEIRVEHNYSQADGLKAPKTYAGLRTVPMPDMVADALQELRASCGNPSSGFAFTRARTKDQPLYPTELWEYWARVARRCGLADADGKPLFHFHALRHAAASLAIAKGLSPLHVKNLIGHARIATTMDVYGHLFPEDQRIALAMKDVAADFSVAQG